MAESEGIKDLVKQVVIQMATAVMMAFRNTEAGPLLTTTAIHRELQGKGTVNQYLKIPHSTGMLRRGMLS